MTDPTGTITDCGSVAEWYFVWHNGKDLLALGTDGKPFKVEQDTPLDNFKKNPCPADNVALCVKDFGSYPIKAKSLTIYITKTN